jgi:glycosyltransferase involved in cell wall biosynthesis
MAKLNPKMNDFKNKHISVTIPAYNEEHTVVRAVNNAERVLKKLTRTYDVLVVDDGSTDSTGTLLDKLSAKKKHVKVIHFKRNQGVGAALRRLYSEVKGDFFFLNAADEQVKMEELLVLAPYIAEYDIVVGRRVNRADSLFRKISASFFNFVIRIRFGIPIRDIDSVKIYRTSVFKKIKLESKTAFIESEILIKAKARGLRMIEVPIRHYPRTKGKAKGIRVRTIIPQLTQLFKAIIRTKW